LTFKAYVCLVVSALCFVPIIGYVKAQEAVTVTPIARGLNNPRGVVVLPDGSLLVAEVGLGTDEPGASTANTGQISQLTDANTDGDYNDPVELTAL